MGVDWAAMEVVFSLEFWRMAVLWTLSLLFSYVQLLRPSPSFPHRRFSPDPASRVKRPICVVTGATSGLGRAAAKALAGEGYHVVLAGRCPQLLSKTIEEIKQQHGDARLNAFQVDLSSIHSIMKFESSLKQWLLDSNLHPSIQLLINNAGMLAKSLRVTVDGFDQMLETNYIGAFALTNLLMPLLKSSTVPSRIVNVTSFTHRCASGVGVDKDTLARKNLCCLSTSKNPADPGAVETNIMRELPPCLSQLAFLVLRFLHLLQSPECGVDSILDAALAPPEASGKYFFGGKGRTIKSSSLSYNEKLAEKLWSASFLLFQEAKCRVPKSAGT